MDIVTQLENSSLLRLLSSLMSLVGLGAWYHVAHVAKRVRNLEVCLRVNVDEEEPTEAGKDHFILEDRVKSNTLKKVNLTKS